VRSYCTRWLRELEDELPTLVFRSIDADGRDRNDTRVFIDGELRFTELDGQAKALDPGAHVIRFEQGAAVSEQNIVVSSGERNRIITARWEAKAAPPSQPTAAPEQSKSAVSFDGPAPPRS